MVVPDTLCGMKGAQSVLDIEPLEPENRMLVAMARKAVERGRPDLAVALAWSAVEESVRPAGAHDYQLILRAPGWAHEIVDRSCQAADGEASILAELTSAAAKAPFAVSTATCNLEPSTQPWRLALWRELNSGLRNQGIVAFAGAYEALGMRFKSWSEVVLAQELARRDIPMMAGPAYLWHGQLREPDFIVFLGGRAFVIEVHGEPWHPAGRTAIDFQRNLIYRLAGLEVLTFDAAEVRADPARVVHLIGDLARSAAA